ncbi:MAG: tRNA 2-thiocytidine biosynthesis protein TtcA [Bacteroidota bacterium]|nr:MAG: tRNA 2-thiocytidine biosynthesis protein TtcA [Bacteroidota bacterium]
MNTRYTENLKRHIWRTIRKQELLSEGDRLMVALSGGKDSLVLLEAIADHSKRLPFKIDVLAVHVLIEEIGYQTDIEYLRTICNNLKIPFMLVRPGFETNSSVEKSMCFICSWHRRKVFFSINREQGYNKLAFGHHMDDAIETLFMNMIYHGSMSSMPYKFDMFNGRLTVIRPMLEVTEEQLELYALERNFKKEVKQCPFENSKRKTLKHKIDLLSDNSNNARKNIFRSMENIFTEYLPQRKE